MAPDLGTKYTCFKCSSKFYDLRKPVPICPKCGADQRDSPPPEPPSAAERRRAKPKPAPDVEALPAIDDEAGPDPEEEGDAEADGAEAAEALDEGD